MELTPDHKPVLARHREKTAEQSAVDDSQGIQLNLLDSLNSEIVQYLQDIDLNHLTPIDALNILAELKKKAGE